MSGSKYGGQVSKMDAPMVAQEAHHMRLDCDKAEQSKTDAAKIAWFDAWARRVSDYLWEQNV